MNYEIIKTGSSGNCTILNGVIAIDMGVPFKDISRFARKLRLVLLTHVHG